MIPFFFLKNYLNFFISTSLLYIQAGYKAGKIELPIKNHDY